MAVHQYYKINEDDIMRLLKEGNQEEELENLKKESIQKKVIQKKVIQKKELKDNLNKWDGYIDTQSKRDDKLNQLLNN